LERAAQRAPRPYHLVVLSDHGQSQGATFKQRYGQSLGELVEHLIAESNLPVAGHMDPDEGWDSLSAALTEALRKESRIRRLVRHALREQMHEGQLALGPKGQATQEQLNQKLSGSKVVVLASGNLGLISFTDSPARLSYEQLRERFPELLVGLSQHEGISFLLVHSEAEGGLVLGAKGIYYLEHGYAVGENPLAGFGPNVAAHLKRTDGFTNAPDILVMSLYRPQTEEVAAFEELVGCHGGLGGPQTQPFVLYPAVLPMDPGPIVGAAALHAQLKTWVRTSLCEDAQPGA
jgi:putative membrane protein